MTSKTVRTYIILPKRLAILRKSKALRVWLVRNPWVRPMCVFNYAAIKIQQHLRGYILRKRKYLHSIVNNVSKKRISNKQLDRYLSFMDKCRKGNVSKPKWLDEGYSSWCAVRIQSFWKMYRINKRHVFSKKLINQVACIIIQTAWRNYMYNKQVAGINDLRQPIIIDAYIAAQMIQLCWRQYCNKRIYRYFRDLVTKNLKGAPYDLLRSIIPNESHLLDRASGVHVRFRLGGRIFPPKVYFKIYTHRPLCDVNSFAPRNYVSERPPDPLQLLNRSSTITPKPTKVQALRVGARYFGAVVSTTSINGTTDWYRRDENNDWRPIASHMFDNIVTPPWFREVAHSSKPKPFHFSKLRREEDIKKARKKRRRQWMAKAYMLATTATVSALEAQGKANQSASGGGESLIKAEEWRGTPHRHTSYNNLAAQDVSTPCSFQYADAKQVTANHIIASYYNQSTSIADEKSQPNNSQKVRDAANDFKRSFNDSDNDCKSTSSVSQSKSSIYTGRSLIEYKAGNNSSTQALLRKSYAQSNAMERMRTTGPIATASAPSRDRGISPSRNGKPLATSADQLVDLVDWRLAYCVVHHCFWNFNLLCPITS